MKNAYPPLDERGIVLVLSALLLPILISVLALAIDLSLTLYERNDAQRAADASAISAAKAAHASENLGAQGNARLAGIREAYAIASLNGFSASCATNANAAPCVTVSSPPALASSPYAGQSDAFEVSITIAQTRIWSVFFNLASTTTTIRAVGSSTANGRLVE